MPTALDLVQQVTIVLQVPQQGLLDDIEHVGKVLGLGSNSKGVWGFISTENALNYQFLKVRMCILILDYWMMDSIAQNSKNVDDHDFRDF